jgi:ABC-2 type transport system permease protein
MPRDNQAWATVLRIAAKETVIFFASPVAYLFLATFAAVTLFVFFWGEAFFARNIADVRPLFEWMPILLIFLASALTMRMWSEERRSGTLEYVHAQPVPLWHFIVGKFLACLGLLLAALLITLPLPVTVALLADLDWGPVGAGYLATFLLGAAYLSMGLFVSARSDNQIVSLISAAALCGVFYLLGTSTVTDFFGIQAAQWLRQLGTGARFESITRGVIDLRDLYYYASLVAVFLVLNALVLERERWSRAAAGNHGGTRLLAGLLIANALAGNLWLGQLKGLRADVTEGRLYSISDATGNYLRQLREPLLIRGYFSARTHPLLAPLVPQLEDLLREYEIAGDGRLRLEIIDPAQWPELEEEANRQFDIHPVPFQVADRYQASIVSSYFNILVQYGDESEVLGFQDLVEIRAGSDAGTEVQLRNPEHDITRAIRKVLNSYQAGGDLFDTVSGNLQVTAYVSPRERLPENLASFRDTLEQVLQEYAASADGRLTVEFVDPDAGDGALREQLYEDYGFQPMTTSLLDDDTFFFYITLAGDDLVVQLPPGDLTEAGFRRNLEAGIKRFARGFTRTVALVKPLADPMYTQYGLADNGFTLLREFLGSELNIVEEDLTDGSVAGDADLLLLLAPQINNDRELFAIDQFLMQGGTVILASSPFNMQFVGRSMHMQSHDSGLGDWLAHHGLRVGEQLVMDTQNAPFPLPVTRDVGGFQVQEVRMFDYPYFIDVRGSGLNPDNAITADLPQVSIAWASPITVDETAGQQRHLTPLLRSSEHSWSSDARDVTPGLAAEKIEAMEPSGEQGSQLLGVISEGRFDSYFAGRSSPLLAAEEASGEASEEAVEANSGGSQATDAGPVGGLLERSPESARIILFSSNDFLKDSVIGMAGVAVGSEYLNSLQLMANAVDWSLEDRGLLGIRSRGHFNRTLPAMDRSQQSFWEYLNYGLALVALGLIALLWQLRQRQRRRSFLEYA